MITALIITAIILTAIIITGILNISNFKIINSGLNTSIITFIFVKVNINNLE